MLDNADKPSTHEDIPQDDTEEVNNAEHMARQTVEIQL